MDLLRAMAILAVILAHVVYTYGAPKYLAPLQFGGTGVYLFFMLSGWLLGNQLIKEANVSRSINLKRFWSRRWMRTLPAYFAILILSLVQRYLSNDNVQFPFDYFFLIQNYFYPLEFFYVSWSLAVEEQFYLFIAIFFAVTALLNKNTVFALLTFLFILPVIFRTLGLYGHEFETHVIVDMCLAGVLLAHIANHFSSVWARLCKYAPLLAMLGLAGFTIIVLMRYSLDREVNPDALLLAFIFGSWLLLANSSSEWQQRLYVPGAYYIATRSYSMYLLHPETIAYLGKYADNFPFIIFFGIILVTTMIISEVLYRVVELPFMAMRDRMEICK